MPIDFCCPYWYDEDVQCRREPKTCDKLQEHLQQVHGIGKGHDLYPHPKGIRNKSYRNFLRSQQHLCLHNQIRLPFEVELNEEGQRVDDDMMDIVDPDLNDDLDKAPDYDPKEASRQPVRAPWLDDVAGADLDDFDIQDEDIFNVAITKSTKRKRGESSNNERVEFSDEASTPSQVQRIETEKPKEKPGIPSCPKCHKTFNHQPSVFRHMRNVCNSVGGGHAKYTCMHCRKEVTSLSSHLVYCRKVNKNQEQLPSMADQTPQPFQAALSDDLVDTKGGAKILSMFSEFLCSEKMEDNTRAQYVRYVKYYITPEEEQNQKSFANNLLDPCRDLCNLNFLDQLIFLQLA